MDYKQLINDLMKNINTHIEDSIKNKEKYETQAMKEFFFGQELAYKCILAYINSYIKTSEEIKWFDAKTFMK